MTAIKPVRKSEKVQTSHSVICRKSRSTPGVDNALAREFICQACVRQVILTNADSIPLDVDDPQLEASQGSYLFFPFQVYERPYTGIQPNPEHPVLPVYDSLAWGATLEARVVQATRQQEGRNIALLRGDGCVIHIPDEDTDPR